MNKLTMVNCEITEPAKPLTLEELQKTHEKLQVTLYGTLTEIHGTAKAINRLGEFFTMNGNPIKDAVKTFYTVKLIEQTDIEEGCVELHFIGKSPETYRLW